MIKYIGSKRTLVTLIADVAKRVPGVSRVHDLFTGTTRVAQAFKRAGLSVLANDRATYSEALALCYVEADENLVDKSEIERKLAHLASLPDVDGYFTETFCRRSRYFQPKNGMRVDAMRGEIDRIASSRVEWGILLTSLMEAADRVDSTTGLQMAYLKAWAPRASNDLALRIPKLVPGEGKATRLDATEAVTADGASDLTYLDPPYNQHSYFSNYHIWESLVRNDSPEHYGIACKRIDCQTEKSAFNSKRQAPLAFRELLTACRSRYLLASFSNEGFFTREWIRGALHDVRGEVAAVEVDYKRYVGAQIGIYNPSGDKVGEVSHLRNTELLFLAGPDATQIMSEVHVAPAAERAPVDQLELL